MKKRSLFMAVVLLMFGLNLEADNSEAQIILKVPIDIYIPSNVNFMLESDSGQETTTNRNVLDCMFYDARGHYIPGTLQEINVHNGNYTVVVEYKDIPNNSFIQIKTYKCELILYTKAGHGIFASALTSETNSNLMENITQYEVTGAIE